MDYEEIVSTTVTDKSQLVYNILNIEANFFTKRADMDLQREPVYIDSKYK